MISWPHLQIYISGVEKTQPVTSTQPQQSSNTSWWVLSTAYHRESTVKDAAEEAYKGKRL